MDGISDSVAAAICAEVAKGRYRRDARSSAWVGHLVGHQLNFDAGTKAGRNRAHTIVERLVKKGVLAVEIERDASRHIRMFVVPGLSSGKGRGRGGKA
jgi:hypothetical protein